MLFDGDTLVEQFLHTLGTLFCEPLFVGLGIVVIFPVGKALAVAHHPYLTPHSAVDDGRGGEPFLRMVDESLDPAPGCQAWQQRQTVVPVNICSDATAELVATAVGRHLADIVADELHGIAAIAHPWAMATLGFGGAAVDDGDEVICDDQAVFAFLCGALRREALLDDCHV